jgi:hypothetical protein
VRKTVVVVIVIKKNTSQCLRLAPFSATSDSSTTSEFWMNSGDEIRGEAATTRSHTRGHESIQLSIFNPEEENARDWITDNERAKKMYGWDEYETVHRVSPYLIGEALEWFKRWKISDRKWSNFIIELRCSF